MRVSKKKPRNPLELPWWAIAGFEWILGQSEEFMTIDDVLIEAWTLESESLVYIQFLWPDGKHGLLGISKDTPRWDDPASCSYYRGVGTCSMSCYSEPSCQTDRPKFGWPSERYKF